MPAGSIVICIAVLVENSCMTEHDTTQGPADGRTVTVWYDGDCPLCVREIALMRRLDRDQRIDFVNVSGGEDSTCPMDRATLLSRFHARDVDGRIVSGAAAFAAMWRAIPPLRPLGTLARHGAVLWILERLYRLFLGIRPQLQRFARALESRGTPRRRHQRR
jgi:predicted DCC family thiol-disulfide oxidoreductase YuxK